MKKLVLISGLILIAAQANAAIMYQEYKCGATHGESTPFPIPDAPAMGLRCYVAVGGISGHGINCTLLTTSVFPVGQKTETPLKTISYNDGQATLEADDTNAHVDVKKGLATIAIGNSLFADCKYSEPKL